jgi:outer membrane biogenesis lipoprotein LolB
MMQTVFFTSIHRLFAMNKTLRQCAALMTFLLITCTAHSHLGGNEASVHADGDAWQAKPVATRGKLHTVWTHTTTEGIRIRQYVADTGFVFAVGWDGPLLPDLERLLGAHFAAYHLAVQQRKRNVRVETPSLWLESAGKMRALVGRAYLPDQLPMGINPADIP